MFSVTEAKTNTTIHTKHDICALFCLSIPRCGTGIVFAPGALLSALSTPAQREYPSSFHSDAAAASDCVRKRASL